MWEVAFALALWHSGDSAVWERSGAKRRGEADLASGSITSGRAHDRDATDAFDPISAIPGGKAVEPISNVAFTPTARLAQMHDRLAALGDGVNIVSPALSSFYDSLSDEQKARFDHIAPRAPRHGQAALGDLTTATIRGQCDAGMMAWPTDQIDRVVRPDDAQRAKLQALQSAASQAADTIKGACPSDVPATPPARLAAVGQRLRAMLQGVETMQPPLADFYNSLSDDQKARFNTMGRQLFAQNAGNQSSNE